MGAKQGGAKRNIQKSQVPRTDEGAWETRQRKPGRTGDRKENLSTEEATVRRNREETGKEETEAE